MAGPRAVLIGARPPGAGPEVGQDAPAVVEAALLTGGGDRAYAVGLAMALMEKGVRLDFIGGDEVDGPELRTAPALTYFHFRRNGRKDAGYVEKAWRVLAYYARLIGYAATAKPRVFHILWNNKFEHFDRTLLMLYYKALGKRIVLTAHNVNAAARDGTDSWLNRLTLGIQYRLCDHIFVHTEQMKSELVQAFRVPREAVSVVRFGINEAVPNTALTPAEARERLGIASEERAILFFGNIAAYKGLEHLIEAFEHLVGSGGPYRLIVAGRAKKPSDPYVVDIRDRLARKSVRERSMVRMEFIPDDEVELYFKAADVTVLPYTRIFQSGVMFLAYSFGLPVIATDVGSLREDVVEGETGFVCKPEDPLALAAAIERYFASPLYRELERRRGQIRDYIRERHSWEAVAETTRNVYLEAARR
ncbi:MAG TPA: glycosyltransferase family 4 protein [Hyphomicrobiaceae bacterium]|nr:glycosyltransferase family 4 protein [Hyphomicrobiaceae bacterium]